LKYINKKTELGRSSNNTKKVKELFYQVVEGNGGFEIIVKLLDYHNQLGFFFNHTFQGSNTCFYYLTLRGEAASKSI